jgi:pimeloyl-ACP methyl ester carboxylesterase
MAYQKTNLRWFRIILRIFCSLILLLIGASFVFDYFIQFRMSDQQILNFFEKSKVKGEVRYYQSGGRKIRYVSVGNDSLPVILFIHGSPSSNSFFNAYFRDSLFLRQFKMYAVDRPGYGSSGFGIPEPSIHKQAAIIQPILDSLNRIRHPVILVGASYGSSVACRLAMDYPNLVDGLVLIGPSLAPGEEKTFWFTSTIENPLINWGVPRMFQSANTEKIHHRQELLEMLPLWRNIRIPVMYLQGARDHLIYTSNAEFAKQHLLNAPCLDIQFFKDRPHFIEFSEQAKIRNKILEMYHLVEKKVPDTSGTPHMP